MYATSLKHRPKQQHHGPEQHRREKRVVRHQHNVHHDHRRHDGQHHHDERHVQPDGFEQDARRITHTPPAVRTRVPLPLLDARRVEYVVAFEGGFVVVNNVLKADCALHQFFYYTAT